MADIIFPGEAPQEEIGPTWLPKNVNLKIWQGDKQEFFVDFETNSGTPIDISTTTPTAVIKSNYDSPTSYSFTCTIQGTNRVRVYMSSALSETIPPGDYIWQLQIVDSGGDARTYLAGDVVVVAQVA